MTSAAAESVRIDVSGLEPGQTVPVTVAGVDVLVCNVEGVFHAVENRCSHAALPLTEGKLEGCLLECPVHGARFDVRDGRATERPARRALRCFAIRRDGEAVVVELPASART